MATTTETYHVVKVFLLPAAGRRQGHWMWLGMERGYPTHWPEEIGAYRFPTPPATVTVRAWSGFPWTDRHDLDIPPRVFRIMRTVTEERTEVI